ncbi:transmembrane protein, putative (macronuclear) [Tetrahymena thermophila SB210]|uniref:Transmembrane protein, putative n=1 Tax=Tetrahymena thermophila (strain SB210) TaxID=312017 RepID=W7XHA0_TETTS|nr:transmembrane protein, putative [Tetrahymena thermophila SB210]EWS73726.1 transmembrane protein, putative [Tetrahymena thermophila SB210]|eukprot:XP_012653764.1 transmembrane protein, putative [Tetrahymena thermophila SB210]
MVHADVQIKKRSSKICATLIVQDSQNCLIIMIEFAKNIVLIAVLTLFLMMMESSRDVKIISTSWIPNYVNKI